MTTSHWSPPGVLLSRACRHCNHHRHRCAIRSPAASLTLAVAPGPKSLSLGPPRRLRHHSPVRRRPRPRRLPVGMHRHRDKLCHRDKLRHLANQRPRDPLRHLHLAHLRRPAHLRLPAMPLRRVRRVRRVHRVRRCRPARHHRHRHPHPPTYLRRHPTPRLRQQSTAPRMTAATATTDAGYSETRPSQLRCWPDRAENERVLRCAVVRRDLHRLIPTLPGAWLHR